MKHQVLLVDNHQLVLDGLISLLLQTDDFEVIGTACNGKEGAEKAKILQPDLILMDLEMPVLNGLEASKILKSTSSKYKIIILTMHLDVALVKKLTQIGVNGYMVKDSNRNEFLLGIRQVMAGGSYFSTQITERALSGSHSATSSTFPDINLSERELDVLKLLVEGCSTKEIADSLNIGVETVNTHRKSLLKKMEARNVAHLVKLALKAGLVL